MSSPPERQKEDCCLITGGAGNLARRLARVLGPQFRRLILTDIQPSPAPTFTGHANYERLDIGDLAGLVELVQRYRPNAIVHLASLLSGSSEVDRRKAWHINTTATLEILEQALSLPSCRVLFASSLATYAGNLPDLVTDDVPQWPATLYGVSKVACERLGDYFRTAHNLDFRCVRLPIILSPEAPPQAVSAIVSRAMVESAEKGRFVFQASPMTRVAALHVQDAVLGMAHLLLAPARQLHQPVYNLSGFSATLGEISAAIRLCWPNAQHDFESDSSVEKVLSRWPGDLDDSAAKRDWNWQPRYNLTESIAHFFREEG